MNRGMAAKNLKLKKLAMKESVDMSLRDSMLEPYKGGPKRWDYAAYESAYSTAIRERRDLCVR